MNTQTNAPVANAPVKKLAHTSEVFMVEIEGKTNAQIIEEIKAAGYVLGSKSLAALLSGEKTTAGDFEMIEVKFDPKAAKAAKAAAADAAKAAKAAAAENKPAEVAAPAAPAAPAPKKSAGKKELTPEQAKLAGEVEKEIPTREAAAPVEKAPRVLNDVSHLLPAPGTYSPLLKGSVMARMFEMLVRPEGATKAELMAEFGWSAGGLAGIIHWEPKKKGYHLGSEKKDGVIHYDLRFNAADPARPNGHIQRVTAEELTYREKKPAPVVKSAEDKAAEKAAKDAAKATTKAAADAAKPAKEVKVKVTKEQKAQVPPMGAANITKRVSAKKAAAAA